MPLTKLRGVKVVENIYYTYAVTWKEQNYVKHQFSITNKSLDMFMGEVWKFELYILHLCIHLYWLLLTYT